MKSSRYAAQLLPPWPPPPSSNATAHSSHLPPYPLTLTQTHTPTNTHIHTRIYAVAASNAHLFLTRECRLRMLGDSFAIVRVCTRVCVRYVCVLGVSPTEGAFPLTPSPSWTRSEAARDWLLLLLLANIVVLSEGGYASPPPPSQLLTRCLCVCVCVCA